MRFSALFCLPLSGLACSYVEVPWKNATGATSYLIARTMELSDVFNSVTYSIEAFPRGKDGKFGFVGPMSHLSLPGPEYTCLFDGLNEAGLSVSAHYFAEAVYEEPAPGRQQIIAKDLVPFLLANCSSVAEAVSLLASVQVVSAKVLNWGGHWAIADAEGNSVVVEYLQGKRVVSENPPRVMTNDPEIRWQWRNLNTYVNLSPKYPWQNDVVQVKVDDDIGTIPRPIGHGWNLFGMPGDFSPPSRYVRLFYLRGYAVEMSFPKSLNDAIVLGTALLNNVFIPYGTVASDPREKGDNAEYTPYAVLKSPKDKVMMVRGRVLVLRMHLIEPPCAKAAFCRRSSICFCGWAGVAGGRLVFDHDQSRLNCQGTSATSFVRVLRFRFPSTDTMRMSRQIPGAKTNSTNPTNAWRL
ncbi:unnamed protein product [Effrenium voratum]|nr:unnamed protein product [Effrenium voratum]